MPPSIPASNLPILPGLPSIPIFRIMVPARPVIPLLRLESISPANNCSAVMSEVGSRKLFALIPLRAIVALSLTSCLPMGVFRRPTKLEAFAEAVKVLVPLSS